MERARNWVARPETAPSEMGLGVQARIALVHEVGVRLEGKPYAALKLLASIPMPGRPRIELVVPISYSPAENAGGMPGPLVGVHRLKFACSVDGREEEVARAFFAGVERHEKGSQTWSRCDDPSV